jgi:hypothetical protein
VKTAAEEKQAEEAAAVRPAAEEIGLATGETEEAAVERREEAAVERRKEAAVERREEVALAAAALVVAGLQGGAVAVEGWPVVQESSAAGPVAGSAAPLGAVRGEADVEGADVEGADAEEADVPAVVLQERCHRPGRSSEDVCRRRNTFRRLGRMSVPEIKN